MKLIPEGFSRSFGRKGLILQKESPQLLLGAGIFGIVTSTVLACRATLKLEETLKATEERLEKFKKAEIVEEYPKEQQQRDVALTYVQGGINVVRLYGPALAVGTASLAAIVQSNRILTRRNAALMAAYAAVEHAFQEYRDRVVDRYGEDIDRELRYGTEKVEVINEETGRKKLVTRVSSNDPSMYARFFDQHCGPWSKDWETNYTYVRAQKTYFNNLLISRGHVFLNEVYDAFDIPHSRAGSIVGWIMTESGETDNFMDFGLFTKNTQEVRDFMNGREHSILLDFNVDGVIFDKIDTPVAPLSWQKG